MNIRNFFFACLCTIGLVQAETASATWVRDYVRTIPDFPKSGVSFLCISPLLKNPQAFAKVIDTLAERYVDKKIDAITGLDSRGFIFGAALAYKMQLPFILIRKPGKLPGDVEKVGYALEYGHNTVEIQRDALSPGERVLVVDDILATGGTAAAACTLVERLGAEVVEVAVIIELGFLSGREKVIQPVFSLEVF